MAGQNVCGGFLKAGKLHFFQMCEKVIAARANVEACREFEDEICAIFKEKHKLNDKDADGNGKNSSKKKLISEEPVFDEAETAILFG